MNTKLVLSGALIMGACTLIAFTQVYNFYGLMAIRFMTGFFQVFQSIYFPVWADTFGGTEKQKTMWLTVLILCGPVGVLLGYIVAAAYISNTDWRWAFYTQVAIMIPVIFAILIVPLKYMDLEKEAKKKIRPISAETAAEDLE